MDDSDAKILAQIDELSVPNPNSEPFRIRDISNCFDRAKWHLKREDKDDLAQDLVQAQTYYLQAQGMLRDESLERAEYLQVYNGLMRVNLNMSFSRKLPVAEKSSKLETAFEYCHKAFKIALPSPVNSGDLAQVKLQEAVLKVRRAEIEKRRGSNREVIRALRNDTSRELELALKDLRDSNHPNIVEFREWGESWHDRLRRL